MRQRAVGQGGRASRCRGGFVLGRRERLLAVQRGATGCGARRATDRLLAVLRCATGHKELACHAHEEEPPHRLKLLSHALVLLLQH